jgi:NAD(P)-dependent dehydrogenase (short-subunit alcohol dehydrogenase family)
MNPSQKTVVISGASSGIGRACVLRMSEAGWHIFATVRKEADRARLERENSRNVYPVILDVEDGESITGAARQIELQLDGRGLDGLVNVAGIGMVGPVEFAAMADLRKIFEVNFFGQVAIIQALSPLLRKNRGRIVNITTIGVNLALPFGALLNASKSAFSMVSDSLRMEMHPLGVKVSAIEPAAISTPAVDKTLGNIEQVIESLPQDAQTLYGPTIRNFARRGYEMEKNGSSPDVVASAVHHALTSPRPKIRYRVGKHATLLAMLPRVLPEGILDALRLRLSGLSLLETTRRETTRRRQIKRGPSPIRTARPSVVNPN